MDPLLRYVIAFVVAAHGLTYIPFGLLVPGRLEGWRGRSWLLGDAVSSDAFGTLVVVLHVMAGIAIFLCACSIAFAPSYPGLWRPLGVLGATSGLAAFIVFWDGQPRLVVEEGAVGALISLMLLVSAVAFGGAFA